jgi:hypothetical protein
MMAFSSLGEEKCLPPGSSPAVDLAAAVVLIAPAADGVEVLQAEADGVEDLVAVVAHGVGAMQLGALAQGQIATFF